MRQCYFDPVEAEKARVALQKAGFGAVLTHVQDGIVRGTGALVALSEDPRKALLIPEASAHYSFRKGTSSQDYPRSLMGATALLKQTHFRCGLVRGCFAFERATGVEFVVRSIQCSTRFAGIF